MAAHIIQPTLSVEGSNYETPQPVKDEASSRMVNPIILDHHDSSSSSNGNSSLSSCSGSSNRGFMRKTIQHEQAHVPNAASVASSSHAPSAVERLTVAAKPPPKTCEVCRRRESPRTQYLLGGHQNADRQETIRQRLAVDLGSVGNHEMDYHYSPYPQGYGYHNGPRHPFVPTGSMGHPAHIGPQGIHLWAPQESWGQFGNNNNPEPASNFVELTLAGPYANQDPNLEGPGFPQLTLGLPYGQIPPGFGHDEPNESGLDLTLRLSDGTK